MEKEMMTVRDLASYLNLNEKIVYKLVREGKIPGTRVTGKWTFSKYIIRSWMESHSLEGFRRWDFPPRTLSSTDLFVSGSNDLILERILSAVLNKESPDIMVYFCNTGSMGGVKALQMGKAHVAGMHLYDPESGLYNTPYLKEHLSNQDILLYNLAYRTQGIIMKHTITVSGIKEIISKKLRLINREVGSGTRLLLDLICEEEGSSTKDIIGYGNEVYTHFEVGHSILKGEADVGFGIQSVAESLGLKFHPLRKEQYDLAVNSKDLTLRPVQALFNTIHSKQFRRIVKGLSGYDLKDSGKLIRSA